MGGSSPSCRRAAQALPGAWTPWLEGVARCHRAACRVLEDVVELAAGGLVEADDPSLGFTCAVRAADTVVCWGDNLIHLLGSDPESTVRSESAFVRSQPGWVPAGRRDARRRRRGARRAPSTRRATCGAGETVPPEPPARRGCAARPTLQRAAGGRHSCGTGQVACWGWNLNGQSGGGPIFDSADEVVEVVGVTLVESVAGARAVVTGRRHSCALLDDGSVVCWGSNQSGQLGS